MKTILRIIFILALSVVTLRSAVADNVKSYHGAICVSTVEGSESNLHTVYGMTAGSLTEDVKVVCPLIRDEQILSSQINSVYIEFRNRDAGSLFLCTLYSQNENDVGEVLDWHELSTTSSVSAGQLGPFSVDTTPGYEGTYSVVCQMQTSDRIFHIYVRERE